MHRHIEKTPKLASAVKNAVDAYPFLKTPMELGLVNYSALARKLKPQLEKQLKQDVTVEAIAMALHRHVEHIPVPGQNGPLRSVAACKLNLLPDMAAIHYRFSRKIQERLHDAKTEIEHQGGNLYMVERMNEISVLTQSQFVPPLKKLADKAQWLSDFQNLSLLTVEYPPESLKQPGLLNYLVQSLNQIQVNILGVFTSYSKISFVIAENDAPVAYDRLSRSIAAAKSME